jgi:hypothetical protein
MSYTTKKKKNNIYRIVQDIIHKGPSYAAKQLVSGFSPHWFANLFMQDIAIEESADFTGWPNHCRSSDHTSLRRLYLAFSMEAPL